jgi:hypothetical protein
MKIRFFGQSRQGAPDASNSDPSPRIFHLRKAGIVTGWYLAQRFEEECYRAERYERPLALLLSEPEPGSDENTVETWIGEWLIIGLRMTDIAAYLGGARYAILLPETDRAKAAKLAARLRASVQQARTAVAAFPQDGRNLGELVAAAKRQLDEIASSGSERRVA